MNRIYPYTYQEEIPTPNKPSEIITFWVDEAGNKYIQKLQQENKQLKEKIKKVIKCIKNQYYEKEYRAKGTFVNKLMVILGEKENE